MTPAYASQQAASAAVESPATLIQAKASGGAPIIATAASATAPKVTNAPHPTRTVTGAASAAISSTTSASETDRISRARAARYAASSNVPFSRIRSSRRSSPNSVPPLRLIPSFAPGVAIARSSMIRCHQENPEPRPAQAEPLQKVNARRVRPAIETGDREVEAARLQRLGAREVARIRSWIVMAAPSGHRFCPVPLQAGSFPGDAKAWR